MFAVVLEVIWALTLAFLLICFAVVSTASVATFVLVTGFWGGVLWLAYKHAQSKRPRSSLEGPK